MKRRTRERGFALLVVLGALPVLAMLGSEVALSGRTEVRLALNLREAAMREAAADGAIREAIFHLVAGDWEADGSPREIRVGGRAVEVRIDNENGKINPSVAPLVLLRALLLSIGESPSRADSLAACIVDYRDARPTASPHGAKAAEYRAAGKAYGPPGLPFERLDELRLVLGMSRETYDRLVPHLSVHSGQWVDLAHADPVVRSAYHLAGPNGGYLADITPDQTVLAGVHARAIDPDGASAERLATVQLYDSGTPDQAFDVLDWRSERRP